MRLHQPVPPQRQPHLGLPEAGFAAGGYVDNQSTSLPPVAGLGMATSGPDDSQQNTTSASSAPQAGYTQTAGETPTYPGNPPTNSNYGSTPNQNNSMGTTPQGEGSTTGANAGTYNSAANSYGGSGSNAYGSWGTQGGSAAPTATDPSFGIPSQALAKGGVVKGYDSGGYVDQSDDQGDTSGGSGGAPNNNGSDQNNVEQDLAALSPSQSGGSGDYSAQPQQAATPNTGDQQSSSPDPNDLLNGAGSSDPQVLNMVQGAQDLYSSIRDAVFGGAQSDSQEPQQPGLMDNISHAMYGPTDTGEQTDMISAMKLGQGRLFQPTVQLPPGET